MSELEVDAQDVVRLMLQFCKENGLKVPCSPPVLPHPNTRASQTLPILLHSHAACRHCMSPQYSLMGCESPPRCMHDCLRRRDAEQESLKTLQTESQVALNTVESVEGFLTGRNSQNPALNSICYMIDCAADF